MNIYKQSNVFKVPPNGGKDVGFPILASSIGLFDVEVTATHTINRDAVIKKLLIVVCIFFNCN